VVRVPQPGAVPVFPAGAGSMDYPTRGSMGQAGLAKPASMAMLCLALPNFRAAAKVAARGWNFEEVMAIDGGEAAIRMIIASVLADHGEIGGRAFDAAGCNATGGGHC
jgi:hypothetical protein